MIDYLASRFTGRIHCATPEVEVARKARVSRIAARLSPQDRKAFVKLCIEHHRQNVEVWRMFK